MSGMIHFKLMKSKSLSWLMKFLWFVLDYSDLQLLDTMRMFLCVCFFLWFCYWDFFLMPFCSTSLGKRVFQKNTHPPSTSTAGVFCWFLLGKIKTLNLAILFETKETNGHSLLTYSPIRGAQTKHHHHEKPSETSARIESKCFHFCTKEVSW